MQLDAEFLQLEPPINFQPDVCILQRSYNTHTQKKNMHCAL